MHELNYENDEPEWSEYKAGVIETLNNVSECGNFYRVGNFAVFEDSSGMHIHFFTKKELKQYIKELQEMADAMRDDNQPWKDKNVQEHFDLEVN